MNKEIDVVINIDNGFIDLAKRTLVSIDRNTNSKINIHVITFSDFKKKLFLEFTNKLVSVNKVNFYIADDLKIDLNSIFLKHISAVAFNRLLIPHFLNSKEKVIYIDCDLIFKRDIKDLYDSADISETPIAGVKEIFWTALVRSFYSSKKFPYFKDELKHVDYINSGVMLLNPKKLFNDGYEKKLVNLLSKYEDFYFGDQDILNLVQPKKIFISSSWNQTLGFLLWRFGIVKKTYVVHYVTKIKPWSGFGSLLILLLVLGFMRVKPWFKYNKIVKEMEKK